MKRSPYKILFASIPADGHFNPLTGLAAYLKAQGDDVRWYTGSVYESRLEKMSIPFYPFNRALEITQDNLNEIFPEREKIKGAIARIKFDLRNLFLKNVNANLKDIEQIRIQFDFDVLICDPGFMAFNLVQQVLKVPAVVLGIAPIPESSQDLPPYGLGLTPGEGKMGRMRNAMLRVVFQKLLFSDSKKYYNELIRPYGLPEMSESIFDMTVRRPALFLQSGVPGFEYSRSDLHENVRFVGPLLPAKKLDTLPFNFAALACHYEKTILISQGTIDNKDPEKLIVPSLEAFAGKPYLLLVATGGQHTAALRQRFKQKNIIIANFIDYIAALPHTDLFITCGGYGSVLLSLNHGVPILAAGKHEGKNEIVARVGYFKLGINLRTETPTIAQISKGAQKVWSDPLYKSNVVAIKNEFAQYNPYPLSEKYIIKAIKNFSFSALTER
ncbi:glycosyltransferase [Dyadobacter sp. CY107]|uniref:glycosyltransferase n=1 Tax=Dyadobacter fanqingshengii TaxID=2906443 RepID=UPI001F23501C|nr:nucleotide disphospho-sugar-binding domain-containing protein [Dyadobacter fanqingshengii]MCF2502101.1 glycosyltransferase [Dyadobacter fanqingshengii]